MNGGEVVEEWGTDPQHSDITRCPECETASIRRDDSGDRYCGECGYLISATELVCDDPAWVDEAEQRVGPPGSVDCVNIGTLVGHGNTTPGSRKLVRYNQRLEPQAASLRKGLREIRAISAAAELSKTSSRRAAHLYREMAAADELQGRSIEAVAAACVYIATREYGPPLTLDEVAEASAVSANTVATTYRNLAVAHEVRVKPPKPQDFVNKIVTELGLPPSSCQPIRKLLHQYSDQGYHIGKHPAGLAAAAAYAVGQDLDADITQAEAAEAAGVSVTTISKQSRELQQTAAF